MLAVYLPVATGIAIMAIGLSAVAVAVRRGTRRVTIERRLMRFTAAGAVHGSTTRRNGWRALAPLARMGRVLTTNPADRERLTRQMIAAGLEHPDAPFLFVSLRLLVVLAACTLLTALYWGGNYGPGMALAYGMLAGGIAYVLPGRILGFIADRRAQQISRELPFALDLIQLALGGGSSIEQAMRFAANLDPNPAPHIRDVLRALLDDLARGMTYEAALDRWGRRLSIEEGRELAGMFHQSLLHGAELSPGLRTLVAEFTDRRLTRARESIGRKSTKLTVVMVTFFLPVLILLLAAPAITAIVQGLGSLAKR